MHTLIAYLVAIKGYCKNLHYMVSHESFYAKHKFVDEIQDPLTDFIDSIKEVCLLGRFPMGERPKLTQEYDDIANELYPLAVVNEDTENFISLQKLIERCLMHIETMTELTKGEENLIGAIAEHLQKYNGLLNLQNEK